MSGTPDPVPDPTQTPPAAPAPPPDDLDALVDRLSQFDPAEIARRLEALESSSVGSGDPPPWLEEIKQRLDELGAGLKSLLEPKRQKPKPADPPADPPPTQPPADPPVELHPPRGSMMSKLWDTPVIGQRNG